jgi:hypothetical protein
VACRVVCYRGGAWHCRVCKDRRRTPQGDVVARKRSDNRSARTLSRKRSKSEQGERRHSLPTETVGANEYGCMISTEQPALHRVMARKRPCSQTFHRDEKPPISAARYRGVDGLARERRSCSHRLSPEPHPSSASSRLLQRLTLKIGRFMQPLTEAETALSV